MNTVNVHLIFLVKDTKSHITFLSSKNIWLKSQVLLLIYKLIIPLQTVIGKIFVRLSQKDLEKLRIKSTQYSAKYPHSGIGSEASKPTRGYRLWRKQFISLNINLDTTRRFRSDGKADISWVIKKRRLEKKNLCYILFNFAKGPCSMRDFLAGTTWRNAFSDGSFKQCSFCFHKSWSSFLLA